MERNISIVGKNKQINTLAEALKTEFFTTQDVKGFYNIYKDGDTILALIKGLYSIDLYQNYEFQKVFFSRCIFLTNGLSKKIRLENFFRSVIDHDYIRSFLIDEEQMHLYAGIEAYKEALRSYILKFPSDYNEKQFEILFAKCISGLSDYPKHESFCNYWKPSKIYVNRSNQNAYYDDSILFSSSLISKLVHAFSLYEPLYFLHFWRLTKQEPSFFIDFLNASNHLEAYKRFLDNLTDNETEAYLSNSSTEFLNALSALKIRFPHYDLVTQFGYKNDQGYFWSVKDDSFSFKPQRVDVFFKVGSFLNTKIPKKETVLASLKTNHLFILDAMFETNYISKALLLKVYETTSYDFSTQARSYVLSHSEGTQLSTPAELAFKKQAKESNEASISQAIESQDVETIALQLPLLDKNLVQHLSPKLYLLAFEGNHPTILNYLKTKKIPLHRVKKTIESAIEYIASLGSVDSFKQAFAMTSSLDEYTLSRLLEIAVERNEIEIGRIIFETYDFIPFTARAMGMALFGGFTNWVQLLIKHEGTILTRLKLEDSDFNTYKLIERSKGFEGPGNEYPAELSCLAISDRFRYLGKYNPVENMKKGSENDRLACIQLLLKHKLYDDFSLGLIVTLAFHEDNLTIVDALLPFSPYVLEKVRTLTKRSIGFSSLSKASRKILDAYIDKDEDKVITESSLKFNVENGL